MQGLRGRAVAGTLTAILLCTGCAEQNEPAARAAAVIFADDLASDDGAGACRALAPATRAALEQSSARPCAAAILEEELPDPGAAGRSASFGTMAKVDFAADTMFVAEFSDGWRVVAAGCSHTPGDRPYDCSLQGG